MLFRVDVHRQANIATNKINDVCPGDPSQPLDLKYVTSVQSLRFSPPGLPCGEGLLPLPVYETARHSADCKTDGAGSDDAPDRTCRCTDGTVS